MQRPEHGRRFAELLPDARLVEIADSYTLIMRDQPQAFARAIREFVRATARGAAPVRMRSADLAPYARRRRFSAGGAGVGGWRWPAPSSIRLVIAWLSNCVALLVAAAVIPAIGYDKDAGTLLLAGLTSASSTSSCARRSSC